MATTNPNNNELLDMLKINLKPNRDELVSKNQAVIDNLSQNFKQEKGEELREKKIATLQTEIETLQTEIDTLQKKEEKYTTKTLT